MTTKESRNTQGSDSHLGNDPFRETDPGIFFGSFADDAKSYFEAQKEFYALTFSQQVGKLVGGLISNLLAAVLLSATLLFSSIALAIWLGTLVDSSALGFLIVAGIYLVFFLLFRVLWIAGLKNKLMISIINSIHITDEKQ